MFINSAYICNSSETKCFCEAAKLYVHFKKWYVLQTFPSSRRLIIDVLTWFVQCDFSVRLSLILLK